MVSLEEKGEEVSIYKKNVKMKAELEFLLLPSKECLSASEDGRGKKEFCRAFRDSY